MKSMQWMHAGLSSIQIYKAHRQEGTKAATTLVSMGTQTRALGTLYTHLRVFLLIVTLNGISNAYHAATDVGMLVKMHINVLCPLFVYLAYQCCCCFSSFLFVCMLCRPICMLDNPASIRHFENWLGFTSSKHHVS